MDESDDVDKPQ